MECTERCGARTQRFSYYQQRTVRIMKRLIRNNENRTYMLWEYPEKNGKVVEAANGTLLGKFSEEFVHNLLVESVKNYINK